MQILPYAQGAPKPAPRRERCQRSECWWVRPVLVARTQRADSGPCGERPGHWRQRHHRAGLPGGARPGAAPRRHGAGACAPHSRMGPHTGERGARARYTGEHVLRAVAERCRARRAGVRGDAVHRHVHLDRGGLGAAARRASRVALDGRPARHSRRRHRARAPHPARVAQVRPLPLIRTSLTEVIVSL